MNLKYLKNVVSLELDDKKCIKCGMCLEVCPHNVFQNCNNQVIIQEKDACMECGACAKNCPAQAITVKSGVGCAFAVYSSMLTGKEPQCGCDDDNCSNCC